MIKYEEDKKGINSFYIRLFGMAGTVWGLMQNLGSINLAETDWSTCMLWFAVTIFSFLLVEGFYNTSDRLLYIRRFAVFTILSEVPYDLLTFGSFWDVREQSIMLTLFIGLLSIYFLDFIRVKLHNVVISIAFIILVSKFVTLGAQKINCLFADAAILIILMFYVAHNVTYSRLFVFTCIAIAMLAAEVETVFNITFRGYQYSITVILFAMLAAIITFFYDGKRGPNNLPLKIAFYLFYPLTMLIIYLIG